MIFKILYSYFRGYVEILVEGFFVERFINICMQKSILLWNLKKPKETIVEAKIGLSDFKKIKKIAKQTKCRIKIKKKNGFPFFIYRYKKRKFFAITFLVIAILIFITTRYIWNVEIKGVALIPEEEILLELKNNGIEVGKKISKIDLDNVINQIRIDRNDIAWIGIEIKGTNAIVNVVEAEEKPKIIDENKNCNIIAKKDGIITKTNVQNGTAIVSSGDVVKKGDILVEGIIEGKYTGVRNVRAQADIFAKVWYLKERTLPLEEESESQTGRTKDQFQIKINNFKINLNKGVSKFENYDTISSSKKLKIFSNLYIPVEINRITYIEKEKRTKKYSIEELTNKMKTELEKELIEEMQIDEKNILDRNYIELNDNKNVYLKIVLTVEEKIGEEVEIDI